MKRRSADLKRKVPSLFRYLIKGDGQREGITIKSVKLNQGLKLHNNYKLNRGEGGNE